jgi:hypothetical protein
VASQLELPRKQSGTRWTETAKKYWESTIGLNQVKGLASGPSARRKEGSVEIKQRPIKMGGRTLYRTLSPKRAPFKIGTDWRSHLQKVPRRRQISHTYPMWLWGCSLFKILSPGPVLHGTKWLPWCPHLQSPTLHWRCGINTGLIKREAQ